MPKITIPLLKEMKEQQEKIAMLTAYDFPQALMVDEAGIEVVLVGDS
jgi:3-methyl-2-oxobutanoate hydroxymethyltransferase